MHPLLAVSTASEYAYRAALGLARHHHASGKECQVSVENTNHVARLHWSPGLPKSDERLDFQRVTEDAAEAISLALVSVARNWVVRRRLQRGEFADWLLVDDEKRAVALEVSGIDKVDVGMRRLHEKTEQVRKSTAAIRAACVVELLPPRTRLVIG